MKRWIARSVLCLVLLTLLPVTARAANQVSEIAIDVALRPDGSAYITQTWTASAHEGTEFYLFYYDNGYQTYSDLLVSDENGPYETLPSWDVDASFGQKARKCGIVRYDDGVELCWGISEYGNHRYALEYVVDNFVTAYSDADGIYYRFLEDLSVFPTDVLLQVRLQDGTPLTDQQCDVWGFGFDGELAFGEDAIYAYTTTALDTGDHFTLLLSLGQGLLQPAHRSDDTFLSRQEMAMEGSDYGPPQEAFPETILFIGPFLVFLAAFAWVITDFIRRKRRMRRLEREAPYFRDIPQAGRLDLSYALGKAFGLCEEQSIFGAYLLRLLLKGSLQPEGEEDTTLRLMGAPEEGDSRELALYALLEQAAGENGILEPKELQRFGKTNARLLESFLTQCLREGNTAMSREGFLRKVGSNNPKHLTEPGTHALQELMGLKKYLLDFSLIRERYVVETAIWREYMVYAFLLGIADRVEEQLEELCPAGVPEARQYPRYVRYTGSYNRVLYSAVRRERNRQAAARSAGSGGRSSRGGGSRGFSGGGRGGSR